MKILVCGKLWLTLYLILYSLTLRGVAVDAFAADQAIGEGAEARVGAQQLQSCSAAGVKNRMRGAIWEAFVRRLCS